MFHGKSMGTFPDNRRVLQELLAVEQSKRVRQQVAEMLYATSGKLQQDLP
jgi:ribosomal protein S17E